MREKSRHTFGHLLRELAGQESWESLVYAIIILPVPNFNIGFGKSKNHEGSLLSIILFLL